MSFRKRNIGLSSGSPRQLDARQSPTKTILPGVRPSPLDGRPTTSTGTTALDGLLAGHAGLALGASLLVEESGTTDYAGALLRYYAAEGLLQGHHVHVIGLPEQWGRNLPGVAGSTGGTDSSKTQDKMKIAWRYENLGQFGGGQASRDRAIPPQAAETTVQPPIFCHAFDLTKKLEHPAAAVLNFIRVEAKGVNSPFEAVLLALSKSIASSNKDVVHRVVLPSLLSPAIYPWQASMPQHVLRFMHGVQAMLAAHADRLTVMASVPLSLHSRSSGLVRWIELLSDGAVELAPFSHTADVEISSKAGTGASEDPPQGILRIHRLPILQERGNGTVLVGDDWAFSLSRRSFSIKPFSLPPIEGDTEAQHGPEVQQKSAKVDLEF